MDKITKEQIDNAMKYVDGELSKYIRETLLDNVNWYNENEKDSLKPYSIYLGVMDTCMQYSNAMMRETLCKLLCDNENKEESNIEE